MTDDDLFGRLRRQADIYRDDVPEMADLLMEAMFFIGGLQRENDRVNDRLRPSYGLLPENAVTVATLTVQWFLDADGNEQCLSKFDGEQRVSVTVGDLTALIHAYLTDDDA